MCAGATVSAAWREQNLRNGFLGWLGSLFEEEKIGTFYMCDECSIITSIASRVLEPAFFKL